MTRAGAILILLVLSSVAKGEERKVAGTEYHSPYSVEFTVPRAELVHDLDHTERGDARLEAEIPHGEWYSHATRDRWKGWGPPARSYPPPALSEGRSAQWKRERALAVGLRFTGYGYQHHHIPDWNPPADWPWKETAVGHNGKGVDCSNFTGFVYNLAFGIRLSTDVHRQAEQRRAPVPRAKSEVPLHHVALPTDFDERARDLRTGDLLFIRDGKGEHISHVVLWVGSIGRSPDDTLLILDSHGEGVKDSDGKHIPAGIQLRPYRKSSWYFRQSSHALRVFPDEK